MAKRIMVCPGLCLGDEVVLVHYRFNALTTTPGFGVLNFNPMWEETEDVINILKLPGEDSGEKITCANCGERARWAYRNIQKAKASVHPGRRYG